MIATPVTARILMMRISIDPSCKIYLLADTRLSSGPLPSELGRPPRSPRAAAGTSPLTVAAMHHTRLGEARAAHPLPRREGEKDQVPVLPQHAADHGSVGMNWKQ